MRIKIGVTNPRSYAGESFEVSIGAAELPGSHGDPADRMLVATAIVHALTLITADDVLLDWKLRGFKAQDATI